MSNDILIFGGTYEGRVLAEALSRSGVSAHVFTATAYGGALIEHLPHLTVHSERLNAQEMREFMDTHSISRVIDATHPYAREVTCNIMRAAKEAGVEYIRVVREKRALPGGDNLTTDGDCGKCPSRNTPCESFPQRSPLQGNTARGTDYCTSSQKMPHSGLPREQVADTKVSRGDISGGISLGENLSHGNKAGSMRNGNSLASSEHRRASPSLNAGGQPGNQRCKEGIVTVADTAGAVAYLTSTRGTVLVTTGSKELEAFCVLPDFAERLYVRVLPMPEVLEHCYSLGFRGAHIIAMQGPFDYDLNAALLRHCGCRYLVTKNTGNAGGLEEKIAAALDSGVVVILIERPVNESGLTLSEVFGFLGLSKT